MAANEETSERRKREPVKRQTGWRKHFHRFRRKTDLATVLKYGLPILGVMLGYDKIQVDNDNFVASRTLSERLTSENRAKELAEELREFRRRLDAIAPRMPVPTEPPPASPPRQPVKE